MLRHKLGLLSVVAVLSAGCNHATIDTGLTPSTEKIEDKWASGWIFGLVPPETVETAEECTNGVARVETELSFLNQLVGILTIGIYTPMSIVVTCALPGSDDTEASEQRSILLNPDASMEEKQRIFGEAIALSAELDAAVYVRSSQQ